MSKLVKQIVIVGGGTAGWLTAGIIAAKYYSSLDQKVFITLVESPQVNTIGVGEGSWPSMRHTLQKIGICENLFIQKCHASFKQGSKFIGWKNGSLDDVYYHPFMNPEGYNKINVHDFWVMNNKTASYAHTVSSQPHVCDESLSPKQLATPEYASVTNYGYHFDANALVELLREYCVNQLNVTHVIDHVVNVNEDKLTSDISSISTKLSGNVSGDLFIDCSGAASLLLGQHYNIPFIEKKNILFNDSAIATQVPYTHSNSAIASTTIATAQESGWIWDIGLSSRRGVGYSYSSTHVDYTLAEETLKKHISQTISEDNLNKLTFKKISFTPGHREKFWQNNCVAIGMSAGFLEPLEASSIAMIELSATMISDELPTNRDHMNLISQRFNERFNYRWQRVIDFLKLHYVLSQRKDSQYWRDNKNPESIPESLANLMSLWRFQPPSRYDFIQNEEIFSSASYQYVLYGMGFNTEISSSSQNNQEQQWASKIFAHFHDKNKKYLSGLASNRDLINHIAK